MLIRNGNIVDVYTGKIVPNDGILITDGRISRIGNVDASACDGEDLLLDKDEYIIPGLIDCHVHMVWNGASNPAAHVASVSDEQLAIEMAIHCMETLKSGITTVRDLASPRNVGFACRQAIKDGVVQGSNLVISGPAVCMTGGHCSDIGYEADGVEAVRHAVRDLCHKGVDCIKLMATGGIYAKEGEMPGSVQYNVEEMAVAVEEAHKRGLPVTAHAEGLEGIRNALAAGVDCIEHANTATEAEWNEFLNRDVWFIPTLVTFQKTQNAAEAGGLPSHIIWKAKSMNEVHMKSFQIAVKKGVKIAVGTDGYGPDNPLGESYFHELNRMVELGMEKAEVLKAATINAAEVLNRKDSLGSIEEGKIADILVLTKNPLEDMDIEKSIRLVIKDGVSVAR